MGSTSEGERKDSCLDREVGCGTGTPVGISEAEMSLQNSPHWAFRQPHTLPPIIGVRCPGS